MKYGLKPCMYIYSIIFRKESFHLSSIQKRKIQNIFTHTDESTYQPSPHNLHHIISNKNNNSLLGPSIFILCLFVRVYMCVYIWLQIVLTSAWLMAFYGFESTPLQICLFLRKKVNETQIL